MPKKTTEDGSEETQSTGQSTGSVFYWLKTRAYISGQTDPKTGQDTEEYKLLDRGVYEFPGRHERLDKNTTEYVESYEGSIPTAALHEIAKSFGITVQVGKDFVPDADLMEKLVIK
jgi:hypothetical protein